MIAWISQIVLAFLRLFNSAVTGLPIPQDNHAIIMTRFAATLIMKMNQVINRDDILMALGDDTATLEMRVGMHR